MHPLKVQWCKSASHLQILHNDIAFTFPIHGETSLEELAHKCRLNDVHLRRLLHLAMVWHPVFRTPRKGFDAHAAASRHGAWDTATDQRKRGSFCISRPIHGLPPPSSPPF